MTQYIVRNIATQNIDGAVTTDGAVDLGPYTAPGCELIPYAGVVDLTPPTPTSALRWNDPVLAWIELADIDARRERKADEMSLACADAIFAGFASSALGASFTYPSKFTDQQNLTACVMRSFYPSLPVDWSTKFWCADGDGAWAWRPHTAAQIQQVGVDGTNAVMGCMGINDQLAKQIATASVGQLAAIAWPS